MEKNIKDLTNNQTNHNNQLIWKQSINGSDLFEIIPSKKINTNYLQKFIRNLLNKDWKYGKIGNYEYIFEISNEKPTWLNLDSQQARNYNLLFAFDTEYRNREWNKKVKDLTSDCFFNDIISYQIAAWNNETNTFLKLEVFLYNDKDKTFKDRLKLSQLVGLTYKLTKQPYNSLFDKNNKKYSKKILFLAHFSVAEFQSLPLFDTKLLKEMKVLQIVRKTFVTFKSFKWKISDWAYNKDHRNKASGIVSMEWRDTILWVPEGYKSLESLADTTTHKKIVLPNKFPKENMVNLLEKDPSLFVNYAINDCLVVLEYACKFLNFVNNNEIVGNSYRRLPVTASGLAGHLLLTWLELESKKIGKESDFFYKLIFGLENKEKIKTEKIFKKNLYEKVYNRIINATYAEHTYLGGKNGYKESTPAEGINLRFNKSGEIVLDIDIDSDYLRCLALQGLIDWKNVKKCSQKKHARELVQEAINAIEREDINHCPIAFIYIKKWNFNRLKEHKLVEAYIAEKHPNGLFYVDIGENIITTFPEFYQSYRIGGISLDDVEEVCLTQAIYESDGKAKVPFATYLSIIKKLRDKHSKNSLENLFYKLLGNGLYGIICQGIVLRKVVNLDGERVSLPESKITNEFYASHITGIARTILGILINKIDTRVGFRVVAWTTDGLILAVKMENIKWPEWIKFDESGYPILEVNNGKIKHNFKFEDLFPNLNNDLQKEPLIRMFLKSKDNLNLESNKWLDIKTFGDSYGCDGTRGNWVDWKGVTQGIARLNIPKNYIQNSEDYKKFAGAADVVEIEIASLTSAYDIYFQGNCGLVNRLKWTREKDEDGKWIKVLTVIKRTVNFGVDRKRFLLSNGESRAFINDNERMTENKVYDVITRKKIKKSTESITQLRNLILSNQLNEKDIYVTKNTTLTIIRMFISIILQNANVNLHSENSINHIFAKVNNYNTLGIKNNEFLKEIGHKHFFKSDKNGKYTKLIESWKRNIINKKSIKKDPFTVKLIKELGIFLGIKLENIDSILKDYFYD